MNYREMKERGFSFDDDGKILDEMGNEFRDECGMICFLNPNSQQDNDEYRYLAVESIGSCAFSAIGKDQIDFYVFLDKHGYNVFQSMEDFMGYLNDDYQYERHCFDDICLGPDEPDYREGVDALDRYLEALNNGVAWNEYPAKEAM